MIMEINQSPNGVSDADDLIKLKNIKIMIINEM